MKCQVKLELLLIAQEILSTGKVDGLQINQLRRQSYADENIDRATVEFLVELYKRVQPQTPLFKRFFFKAIKDHLLAREWVGAEEAHWLRHVLYAVAMVKDEESRLLHEIKSEAKKFGPEFENLCQLGTNLPPKPCTYASEGRLEER